MLHTVDIPVDAVGCQSACSRVAEYDREVIAAPGKAGFRIEDGYHLGIVTCRFKFYRTKVWRVVAEAAIEVAVPVGKVETTAIKEAFVWRRFIRNKEERVGFVRVCIATDHCLPCCKGIVIDTIPAIEQIRPLRPVGIVIHRQVGSRLSIMECPAFATAAEDVIVIGLVATTQKVEGSLTRGGTAVEGIVVPVLVLTVVVECSPAVYIGIGGEEVIGNYEGTARYTVHVIEVHGATSWDGHVVIADLTTPTQVLQVQTVVISTIADSTKGIATNDRLLMPLLVTDTDVVLIAEGVADELVPALALSVTAGPAMEVEAVSTTREEVVFPAVVLVVLVGITTRIGVEEGIV